MPEVNRDKFLSTSGITAWINGPAGSGKTRLAMGFPDVLAVTFDPTGLDVCKEPENRGLLDNLRWHVPLNGLPLSDVFAFTEIPGETGIYAAIALAKKLAVEKKIKTLLIDGFTYLAQLKWTQICEAKGIDPSKKEEASKRDVDQRSMYDALGSYLDHLVLQNILPLSTRYGLNVIVTCHIQRESDNTVSGVKDSRNPDLERGSKRLVNLNSDLSPQIVGGFRQRIEGLPSALIYLEHKLDESEGKEVIKYYAYCRMTRSVSLDTVVKAKNRYGLGTLNLTGASFYKTLLKRLEDSRNATTQPAAAAKAAATTKKES
jgi:hypothetical protein